MKQKTKLLWKTIPQNFESRGHKWEIGKWYHVNGKIELCQNGFHASPTILDAMRYVFAGWICCVTATGDCEIGNDKSAWSDMVIIKRYKWTKKMSVSLAIYAAELVLKIYEKKYPKDTRPRNAIAAAKAYLRNPCKKTKDATYAADGAAGAATRAAYAAHAATYAAHAAAHAAILKKIERKIKQLVGICK